MNIKRGTLSRVRFSGKASEPKPPQLEGGKLTAGVPLPKLIKRRLTSNPELVMLADHRSVTAERFRRLKTMLQHGADGGPQVIVVTSAAPSEGKSVVATNLALAFAGDHQGEVLLIDADLRRPTVERWLSPAPKLGFSELLLGQTEVDHVLLELENSPLRVIPAGTPPRDPVELLSAAMTGRLLETLRTRFQRIVIDTPPIVPFTDADAVGRYADGVLLVARSGSTRRAMLLQALASVTSTQLLGLVLNDVTYSLADRESYYSAKNYYEYYDRERKR
jgi:receptor protein-tyrosine kinase/non-specific protein-tyrosine kinase